MATGLSGDDLINGTSSNDKLNGGAGDDTVDGGSGSDVVNADSGSDTLIYTLSENAGSTDIYDGGSGIDKLVLNFTLAQWRMAAIQTQISNYLTFIGLHTNTTNLQTDNTNYIFDFGTGTTKLTVSKIESVKVFVDGQEVNLLGNNAPVIAGTATGSVMEDALSLGAPTVLATGGNFPYDFDVADVNGDGNADIVTAHVGSGTVAVLLGDGAGGFAAPTTYNMGLTGTGPDTAVVTDVNGDGNADIVTANGNGHSVSVLLADGAGGFAGPATYPTGLGYTQLASVADVSGDGNLDIVASGDAGLAVFLGDGLGGFGAATTYGVAGVSTPASNAIVDVDGDGDADIIAAGLLSDTIAVLLNDGSGIFDAPVLYAAGGSYPQNLVAADVNGDGFADVITANGLSDDVSVLLGDGSGGFGTAAAYDVGANFPGDVSVADVNGDGFVDIVTANVVSDNVSVLLGDGSGGFAAPILYDAGGDGAQHSALADVNGDGLADVIVTNSASNNLSVFLNSSGAPGVSGTLTASDVDTGDTQAWSIQGSSIGTYGSLALLGDTGEWVYTLDNASAAVQSLAAGESHDEFFMVRVTDSAGGYDEQIVTVTVIGSYDAPTVTDFII